VLRLLTARYFSYLDMCCVGAAFGTLIRTGSVWRCLLTMVLGAAISGALSAIAEGGE
jgi:hypothetical protein